MSNENYPPLIRQVKNLAGFSLKLIKYLQEKSDDENNKTLLVSDKVYKERLEICKSCEKYDLNENRCFECGCYLAVKAKFILDDCPLNKWSMEEEDWEEAFKNIITDMEKNSK